MAAFFSMLNEWRQYHYLSHQSFLAQNMLTIEIGFIPSSLDMFAAIAA
jgi:hypothetical protein